MDSWRQPPLPALKLQEGSSIHMEFRMGRAFVYQKRQECRRKGAGAETSVAGEPEAIKPRQPLVFQPLSIPTTTLVPTQSNLQ